MSKYLIYSIMLLSLLVFGCQPTPASEADPDPTQELILIEPATPAAEETEIIKEVIIEEVLTQTPKSSFFADPTKEVQFPPTSTPVPVESDPIEENVMPEGINHPNVSIALSDLSKRLEIGEGEISVINIEEKAWRDSSLGCPQPGMMYMQVIVEGGMLIQLQVNGIVYNYHSGPSRAPFLCENSSE